MGLSPALAGRFRVLEELPGSRYVGRWLVTDEDGSTVEVLSLKTPAIHPAGVRVAFQDMHRKLRDVSDDTLEVGEVEGVPFVVRRPLAEVAAGDITTPVPPEVVAAMGVDLMQRILEAGAASDGSVRLEDIGVNTEGRAVFAPVGRLPGDVTLARAWSAAPEGYEGAEPDGRAGLYGLGLALFQLTTGTLPYPEGQRSDARAGPVPRAASVRPGIPADLDDALAMLMSPEPAQRQAALPLLQSLAADTYDLRSYRRHSAAADLEAVPPSRSTQAGSRGRSTDAPAAATLSARTLGTLSPAALSVAAGAANRSVGEVQSLMEAGLPLVLDVLPSPRAARRRAEELARSTGLPVEAAHGASWWRVPVAMTVLGMGGLTAAGLALGLGFMSATLSLVAALVVLGGSAVLAMGALRLGRARGLAQARQALHHLTEVPAGPEANVRTRIAELRRLLPHLELPEPAAVDVRGALRDVERQMEGLLHARKSLEAASAGLSLEELRHQHQVQSRAAQRSMDAASERDRLARAIADLEHVEQTRQQLEGRISRLSRSLDEIGAVMARLGGDAAGNDLASLDRALDGLGVTVRLVTEAVTDANRSARGAERLGEHS